MMAIPHHVGIGNNSHGGSELAAGSQGFSFIRLQIRATAHCPGKSYDLGLWV